MPEDLGRYLIERGIAQRSRMLRKVRQLFDRFGKPLTEVFDEHGVPVTMDEAV